MTTIEECIQVKLGLCNAGDLVEKLANNFGRDPTSGLAFAMYLAVRRGSILFDDLAEDFKALVAIRPDLAKFRDWASAVKVG